MKTAVLDASALAGVLLDPAHYADVADLFDRDDVEVVVPSLADLEVVSVLRRLTRLGHLDLARAAEAVSLLVELPMRRFEHTALLERVFELRENFSAYDAAYVALAEGLAAPLVTSDAKLARAARALGSLHVTLLAP